MNTDHDMADEAGTDRPEFSVLVTCHYEEKSIHQFFERLKKAWDATGRRYEIIMVNDGSIDGTWAAMETLYEAHAEITAIIDFFRNAGQQAAATAAITASDGRHFFIMDSDLQLSPEDLPLLLEKFDEGYDLVSGYREKRQDSLFRILPSKLANIIMRRASRSNLRDFGCTFKVFHGNLIRALDFGPQNIFNNVDIIAQAGRYAEVPVSHAPRPYGRSGWTFRKLWKYNMENLVKLSQFPFQFLAAACVLLSLLFLLRVFAGFFLPFRIMEEVTNGLILNMLVIVLLVLAAVLSLIGEFTIRCFVMLRQRPGYIVRRQRRRSARPVSAPEKDSGP
jgi:glycosyltransferase involved in cell wall biosynthesis